MRIIESSFITSAVKPHQYPANDHVDIAFGGKSNVGKSSLINALTGRKLLAKTSGTPGKTRLINFFLIRFRDDAQSISGHFNIVDLPGYGFAKVSASEKESWRFMMQDYLKQRKQPVYFVVLIDLRHKPDPKDIMLIHMLGEMQIPFCICATKSDKIAKTKIPSTLKAIKAELRLPGIPCFAVSSHAKTGLPEVLNWIGTVVKPHLPETHEPETV